MSVEEEDEEEEEVERDSFFQPLIDYSIGRFNSPSAQSRPIDKIESNQLLIKV